MDTNLPILSVELQEAVHSHPGEPLHVLDPASNTVYVLLPADRYTSMRELLDHVAPSDTYAAIDRTFATGWSDPVMDDYDHYEDHAK